MASRLWYPTCNMVQRNTQTRPFSPSYTAKHTHGHTYINICERSWAHTQNQIWRLHKFSPSYTRAVHAHPPRGALSHLGVGTPRHECMNMRCSSRICCCCTLVAAWRVRCAAMCMHVCIRVGMYVCMYVCIYNIVCLCDCFVCVCLFTDVAIHINVHMCVCICTYVCISVDECICTHTSHDQVERAPHIEN
jgi:hypothetical protein